jgi:NADH-quinone oxidoreductase subunit J
MTQAVLFYLFSLVAMIAGFSVITARNPLVSALSLVVCFFFLASDYVLLDAHFVAVVQVLVYAGAIMVLFIFVIMLLNLRDDQMPGPMYEMGRRTFAGMAVAGLLGTGLIAGLERVSANFPTSIPKNYGTIADIGTAVFSPQASYMLPFEVVSALLTVALVGAVVLAKREI